MYYFLKSSNIHIFKEFCSKTRKIITLFFNRKKYDNIHEKHQMIMDKQTDKVSYRVHNSLVKVPSKIN